MENKSENKIDNNIESNVRNNVETKKISFKQILSAIEYFIIFSVIFLNSVLVGKALKNPDKTPDLFGKKAFVIVSGSMIPEIQIGDVVIVNETTDVKENDIIAFRNHSTVIVHRIIKTMDIDGEVMYQTKGDNNNIADVELVRESNIEGVYVGKIPYIGKILMFLYNNLAVVVVVVIVILIIKNFVL